MSLSKNLSQFFQGPSGENSSKRLIGIVGGIALIYLGVRGGEHFLSIDNSEDFLNLFDRLCIFVASILGLGLADYKLKKDNKNENSK